MKSYNLIWYFKSKFSLLEIIFDKLNLYFIFSFISNQIFKIFNINKINGRLPNYKITSKIFNKQFNQTKNKNKKALFFLTTSANSYHNFRNLLIAKYLESRGYQSILLVCNGLYDICNIDSIQRDRSEIPLFCYQCYQGYKKINTSTGINVEYLKEYFPVNSQLYLNEKDKIQNLASITACENYKFQGYEVGKYVKISVLRYLMKGTFDTFNNENELLIYKKFIVQAIRLITAYENYLDKNEIDLVLFNNGITAFDFTASKVSLRHKIDFVTQEIFEGPNSWIYSKNNYAIYLDWTDEWENYKQNIKINNGIREIIDKFMINRRSGTNMVYQYNTSNHKNNILEGVEFVALFTNFTWDTAVLERERLFGSIEDWLLKIANYWIAKVENIKLLIRVHPAEHKLGLPSAKYARDILGDLRFNEKIIFYDSFDEVNSYNIIEKMKYGIVYSSSIGMEIAYNNKICLVGARPHYGDKGFTLYPDNQEEFFKNIELLNKDKLNYYIDKETLIKYLHFIYFNKIKIINGFKKESTRIITEKQFNSEQLVKINYKVLDEFYNYLELN